MNFNIEGIIVPMITPMTESGEVDKQGVIWLINFLIDKGINGFLIGGTTGEGPLLSVQERFFLAETVVESVNHRIPVIIHAGAITTLQTIQLAQHAEKIGADGIAIIPPYFYRLREEAILAHYQMIIKSVPNLPVFLYNNPFVLANELSYSIVKRLSDDFKNVVGIKDSSGNLDFLKACNLLRNGEFITFMGNDKFMLPALSMGINGCVSGNANVAPELFVDIFDALQSQNIEKAKNLYNEIGVLISILGDGDITLFKHVLELRGLPKTSSRAPLYPPSQKRTDESQQAFIAFAKNKFDLDQTS
jgi:4-hydroxy-tetrahydrodipicolinate synthase